MTPLVPHPEGYPIKLVRDRTPDIINSSGEPGDLFYAPLSPQDTPPWLRRKLIEEALEYTESRTLDELAQILSVVEAIAERVHGKSLPALLEILRDDPRGGFEMGMMMYGRHPEYDSEGESGG